MSTTPAATLPKGIRQLGKSYAISVTVAGIRKTGTARTLDDAIRLREQLESGLCEEEKASPTPAKASCWTLKEAIEHTYRTEWTTCRSKDALYRLAELALLFFGDVPVDKIDASAIDKFQTHWRGKGNSLASINRKVAALSKVLTTCQRRSGGLVSKPYMQRYRESRGRIRVLSPVEEGTVLGLCSTWDKPDHHDAITCLLDLGLRGSELWRLECRDVDLYGQGVVTIWETKNHNPRTVPMTSRVKAILARRMADLPATGRPFRFKNAWLWKLWGRCKREMKLTGDKGFVPYCLRHTCASRLIQRGIGLSVVQAWLGHKQISMTLRYAHLSPANLLDAVKVLEQ